MGSKFETRLLGELCHEITVGFVGTMTNEYIENGIPFLRSKNIEEYDVKWDDMKYVSSAFHKKLSKSVLKPGDVAIVRTGKPGTTCVIPNDLREANCSDIVIARVNNELLCPHYLSYFMNAMAHGQVNAHIVGAVQQHFNVSSAKKLEIPLPSRVKQTKIVQVLKTLDDKLKLNRQINQTLEQMAQTLFKSWFVDFDPVVDNALDAGFFEQDLGFSEELLHRVEVRKAVRESDNFKPLSEDIRRLFPNAFEECAEPALGLGGWVPKGWKGQPIKTHCVKIQNGGTPSRSNSDYWDGGNIPWLTSGEVRQSIVTNVENTITDLGLQNSSAKWVSSYSTLVALYGATAGEVSINVDPLTTNQAVCALIPKESYCWFNYLQVRNKTIEMQNQAVGSAQQNISKRLVENLIVISPLPYIVEIFNQRVEPLFLKSIFNQKMAMELTKLRDTLLPKLISGELSLSDIKIDIPEETLI
ncbi:restriction endonuclease subunit S [Proteus mirabilis]|uniref:restriction endonuclease subunit S n=1 Tax=Proteus mirabilis TaxID=584 RepID=UPI0005373F81|nr:restriction endonuclease subunit S [Proteus mirabilis]ELA9903652.1 restriction endonuclease subunit S [Proteus mirabilis]MBG2800208.1 restriction endonuclease subunit S [Proteus mirabilis]MBG5974837.1 restriction endonuclease subunit S [Proteus mirabilis]MBI6410880.1 restriction endonuclease subunit S [Proteus mirabilis]MBI6491334.1 restriction endonuclease subunit S [Proteus mirabilis]